MPHISGTILSIQEGRIRLLMADGRGALLLMAPGLAIGARQLATLPGREVRVRQSLAPGLMAAGVAHAIEILDRKDRPQ